jgi:hypothetical protein
VTDAITPDTVLGYLEDVDYPADKDALLAAAERAGAPDEVLRSIRAVPPVDYRSRAEVARSVQVDPGAGRSPGRAAVQARTDAEPGIAEHLRDPQEG